MENSGTKVQKRKMDAEVVEDIMIKKVIKSARPIVLQKTNGTGNTVTQEIKTEGLTSQRQKTGINNAQKKCEVDETDAGSKRKFPKTKTNLSKTSKKKPYATREERKAINKKENKLSALPPGAKMSMLNCWYCQEKNN